MKNRLFSFVATLKLLIILLYPLLSLVFPTQANAAIGLGSCAGVSITADPIKNEYVSTVDKQVTFKVTSGLNPGTGYKIRMVASMGSTPVFYESNTIIANATGGADSDFVLQLPNPATILDTDIPVGLYRADWTEVCQLGTIRQTATGAIDCTVKIYQTRVGQAGACYYNPNDSNSCLNGSMVLIDAVITRNGQPLANTAVDVSIGNTFGWQQRTTDTQGNIGLTRFDSVPKGTYKAEISVDRLGPNQEYCYSVSFPIAETCVDSATGQQKCSTDPNSIITTPTTPTTPGGNNATAPREFKLCSQITNAELKSKCDVCNGKEGVWTAVGCIERTPQSIVKRFLEIGLGVGGGICLLMCLAAGFMLTTSQGDPKQVSEAREMVTSAIIGLLFIIFSVFLLQFIGVTIFNIPGFGGPAIN